MHHIFTILLSVLYMYIAFTGLLNCRMKIQYYLLLAAYLVFLYTIPQAWLSQLVTFPLVFVSITIIYFGSGRNLFEVVFSLTGYLVGVSMNHAITVPLTRMGIPFSDLETRYVIPFLCAVSLGTFALHFCVKKFFLRPKLALLTGCPHKLQFLVLLQLLLCVSLLAVNFIYGELVGYPTEVLSYNGMLISVFTLITLMIFYFLYLLLQKIHTLELERKEQELLRGYTEKLEAYYEEFRIFRHDYKNILTTLSYHINEKDISGLKDYFEEKILPSGDSLASAKYVIGKLYMVKILSIKSILYAKLVVALGQDITLNLELADPLEEVYMDELDLSRILGIMLDNAIEAAGASSEKLLSIAVVVTEDSVVFSVTNSSPHLDIPVSSLYQKGYSTKPDHEGLGMYTIQMLTLPLDNVTYIAEYKDYFYQTLELRRGK